MKFLKFLRLGLLPLQCRSKPKYHAWRRGGERIMKIPIQELPMNQLNALVREWSDALQKKQGQNLKLDR